MKIFVHLDLGIFFSADPPQLCQVGWVPSVDRHFQVSPDMFDWAQVRAQSGALKDVHRIVPMPVLHCLGSELWVMVLLEGEPSATVLSLRICFSLWKSLCYSPFSFPSTLTRMSDADKHTQSRKKMRECMHVQSKHVVCKAQI